MIGTPRYITLDDVKNRTVNKIYYSNTYIFDFNPGPDSVEAGTGTSVILTWDSQPDGWPTLDLEIGLAGLVTQVQDSVTVTGVFKSISNAGYSIVVDNVTGGSFVTKDSAVELEDLTGLVTLEDGDGIGLDIYPIGLNLTDGGVTDDLLGDIISIAEAEIERRLSPLYLIPFECEPEPGIFEPYSELPPTALNYLRDLFITLTLIKLLDMEFGRQDGDRGESYKKDVKGEYAYKISYLMDRDESGKFKYPPLDDLARNLDSFKYEAFIPAPASVNGGCTLNSTLYANQHINDPSRNIFYSNRIHGRTRVTCVTKGTGSRSHN